MQTVTISPRFCETDALGHINNTAFGAWFETGRINYLTSLQQDIVGFKPQWVLATVQMDFRDETFFGHDVSVEVFPVKIGTHRLKWPVA